MKKSLTESLWQKVIRFACKRRDKAVRRRHYNECTHALTERWEHTHLPMDSKSVAKALLVLLAVVVSCLFWGVCIAVAIKFKWSL